MIPKSMKEALALSGSPEEAANDPLRLDVRNLSDQVTEILYRKVLTGALAPGERINEVDLARTLGISRNPIREALRRLEERGILMSSPRRGAFVRTVTSEDIDDTFRFRTLVESFALRNAMPRMTDQHIDELQSIIDKMVEAASRGQGSVVIELDVFFHRRICELSGSRWALRAFNDLYAEVRLLMAVSEQYFESMEASSSAHYRVVEALRTHDPEQAVAAMVAHIADPWRKLVTNSSKGGANGAPDRQAGSKD